MPRSRAKALEDGYDVLLSYCGKDTRHNITDSLNDPSEKARIHVFRVTEKIEVGDNIGEEILQDVGNSRICIPIISQNYLDHKWWCPAKLAHMMKKVSRSEGRRRTTASHGIEMGPKISYDGTHSYRDERSHEQESFPFF